MTSTSETASELIRVWGTVQGVGFRPTVWRLARAEGLVGQVWNDADGVGIRIWGEEQQRQAFVDALQREAPPLARIEKIERSSRQLDRAPETFEIVSSEAGAVQTNVAADAAVCAACLADIRDAEGRRFRYPFTNCTHCGPRLSIIGSIPYDRDNTSMSSFPMCPNCSREYLDPADRRFHAQPNACPVCGPRVWLESVDGNQVVPQEGEDAISAARRFIEQGEIVAIKGIGGIHLACDACNETAVSRLRQRKQRYQKAFALMAADTAMIDCYASLSKSERDALATSAAPIVVLSAAGEEVAKSVAPGQHTLGFMLPYTPLHHLLMQGMARPIVLTSGNRSDEPQCIDNEDARTRLASLADYLLLHDRDIVNRLDDSVVRIADGEPRLLRRARGYAPTPLQLPAGFAGDLTVLAMGAELKNSFCLLQQKRAIVSQHMGDLENAATFEDYRHNLHLYRLLFDHRPRAIAVDKHPNYLSTQLGQGIAQDQGIALVEVQHHHAHIASCMAEHGMALDGSQILGVAMDGLGFGDGGELWGAEFLLVDYFGYRRLAAFTPVAMPGGAQAMREPWRNAFAHLRAFVGWEQVTEEYAQLDIVRLLQSKPLSNLSRMIDRGLNSPPASSCGRLFDAVAAVLGVCAERQWFEGQAAMELEALAEGVFQQFEHYAAFDTVKPQRGKHGTIDFGSLWRSILHDLHQGVAPRQISARFHHSLCRVIAETAIHLCEEHRAVAVVLSGGVFQNRLLLEGTAERLRRSGLQVLSPRELPANDGGIALGQAVVAAARMMRGV